MLTTISLDIIHHHTKLVSFLVMRMFKIRSLSESKVAQSCLTLCDPSVAYQAPPSMGFV